MDPMRTRNLPGCKLRPARKADNLTAICEPIVQKLWEPRRLTTLWASPTCYKVNKHAHAPCRRLGRASKQRTKCKPSVYRLVFALQYIHLVLVNHTHFNFYLH
jgi:hypothetical protein